MTHRFINADGYYYSGESVVGYNMYAYCLNNPVNRTDDNGCSSRKGVRIVLTVLFGFLFMVPDKKTHYERNNKNQVPATPQEVINSNDWERKSDNANIYHRHPVGSQGASAKDNVKYMTTDGHNEVIINFTYKDDPQFVTDPFNVGTYNFGTNWLTHWLFDVFPYWLWGNSEVDSGWDFAWSRIRGAK